jgi:restriction system protein
MPQLNPLPLLAGVAKALAARLSFLHRRGESARLTSARARFEIRWTAELLKQLEWRRFEELCVAYYQALGFTTRVAKAGLDGGVDILLQPQGAERASVIARCKAWDAYRIGTKPVQELRGAMAAAGVGEAVLLTSGRFTQAAFDLAAKEHVELVDGTVLLDKLAALPPEKALGLLKFATQCDFLTPTCPDCSIKMISRQSTQGGRKFWGCRNYPQCKETFSGTANAPA